MSEWVNSNGLVPLVTVPFIPNARIRRPLNVTCLEMARS